MPLTYTIYYYIVITPGVVFLQPPPKCARVYSQLPFDSRFLPIRDDGMKFATGLCSYYCP